MNSCQTSGKNSASKVTHLNKIFLVKMGSFLAYLSPDQNQAQTLI